MPTGPTTSPRHTAAGAVCASLHRAYRDMRFYPPDHPMALQSLDGLTVAVQRYVEQWGGLILDVAEEELLFEGESVYSHGETRDNLAFLMFRDGVRALALHPGIEIDEVEGFVECLAHADDLANVEADLVTVLWERDFTHLDYRAADPFLGGEVIKEGMVDALRETVLHRLEDGQMPREPSRLPDWSQLREVPVQRVDNRAFVLSQEEVERGERAVEGLSSVLDDFSEVLLEIAASRPITEADEALTRAFSAVAAAYMESGDIARSSFLVERLRHMEAQGWSPAGTVEQVVREAVTAEQLNRLLKGLGVASSDEAGSIESFLRRLSPWISAGLLEILTETDDRGVRKSILTLLEARGGVPWSNLEPLLDDPRWFVVRNAVQLAAADRRTQLIDHWQRLLAHPDSRVRREMLRALDRLGGPTAVKGLTAALVDPDSSVRTLAARAIGREGGREQEAVLLAQIEDRNFALRPGEEVRAFLESYAELAQERAIGMLERSWRKRLLSSRPLPFRVAAVVALGRVRDQRARSILIEASRSNEAQIQRAASHALQIQASLLSGGEQ